MSVVVRSLIADAQTLDSVSLPAYAVQTRGKSTAALVAAVAAKTIQMDEVDALSQEMTFQYEEPLTAAAIVVRDNVETLLVKPAGTIAALTVTMPDAPYDGQKFTLATTQIVTALTLNAGTGETVKGALTACTANGFATWQFNKADLAWYRVG